jgi:branched-chain amino acid transport system ATP-binding protein
MYDRRNTIAGELSYAEQRLLEIGITISSGAEVILLDEPMAGLSKEEVSQVSDLIINLSRGKTIVMIEHDMEVIFSIVDRVSVLVYGEIIATGAPESIKKNKKVQEAYLGSVDGLAWK